MKPRSDKKPGGPYYPKPIRFKRKTNRSGKPRPPLPDTGRKPGGPQPDDKRPPEHVVCLGFGGPGRLPNWPKKGLKGGG